MTTRSLTEEQIKAIVHEKVKLHLMQEICQYAVEKKPTLWGEKRPESYEMFVCHAVYLAMYYHITGYGYNRIEKQLKFNYFVSHISLRHNIHVIMAILADWGKKNIVLGDLKGWREAAASCNLGSLLIDT